MLNSCIFNPPQALKKELPKTSINLQVKNLSLTLDFLTPNLGASD